MQKRAAQLTRHRALRNAEPMCNLLQWHAIETHGEQDVSLARRKFLGGTKQQIEVYPRFHHLRRRRSFIDEV